MTLITSPGPFIEMRHSVPQCRLLDALDTDEVACFGKLRHDYFVHEKRWVKENPSQPQVETDRFDPYCLHLLVELAGVPAAYLRALSYRPDIRFMLDEDFRYLLTEEQRVALHHPGSVELSRLVCRNDIAHEGMAHHPIEHLLRLLYRLALEKGYWRFTIVVEVGWIRPFTRRFGLPFQVIGEPYTFPDGTRTVAATATIAELEAGMRSHSLAKFDWYRQGLETPAISIP